MNSRSQATGTGLDGVDLADPSFWRRPAPQRDAVFAELRQVPGMAAFVGPQVDSSRFTGTGYRAAVRHADVLEISRDTKRFSSADGATTTVDMPAEFLEYFGSIINMDDPRHARLRRIVSAGFTPRMLARVEQAVQERASRIVDDLLKAGGCDFVLDVAARLPLEIICDMMGVDEAHHRFVFERSNVLVCNGDAEYVPPGTDFAAALFAAARDLVGVMEELAAARAAEPADDLTSALLHAGDDGDQLTHPELASFFIILLSAGMETTRNAISHALVALTEHPDQRELWRADFERLAPTAVEEIVRWSSPISFMRRSVTVDCTVGGQELVAGDRVLMFYASANRDETVFADPDRFDITRTPNDHVGFGAPGAHFCLGAHLARREMTVMWRELLGRAPGLRAVGEPDRLDSGFINGIKHLACSVA